MQYKKTLLHNLKIESEVSCLKENGINRVCDLPQSLIDKMKMVDALLLTIGCISGYRDLFDKLGTRYIHRNDAPRPQIYFFIVDKLEQPTM